MRSGKVRICGVCLGVSDAVEGRELGVSLRCIRYGRLSLWLRARGWVFAGYQSSGGCAEVRARAEPGGTRCYVISGLCLSISAEA